MKKLFTVLVIVLLALTSVFAQGAKEEQSSNVIKVGATPARNNNKILFFKLLDGCSIYDYHAPIFSFDVNGKTCDDFVRYVTKHNLENYVAVSSARTYRFIDFDDIRIDSINKEVRLI